MCNDFNYLILILIPHHFQQKTNLYFYYFCFTFPSANDTTRGVFLGGRATFLFTASNAILADFILSNVTNPQFLLLPSFPLSI